MLLNPQEAPFTQKSPNTNKLFNYSPTSTSSTNRKTQETEKIQQKNQQQKEKVVRPRPCQSFVFFHFEKYCPCFILKQTQHARNRLDAFTN
jgi:hypothetical protein